MDKRFEELGIRPADILLPGTGTDMSRWAVVACLWGVNGKYKDISP